MSMFRRSKRAAPETRNTKPELPQQGAPANPIEDAARRAFDSLGAGDSVGPYDAAEIKASMGFDPNDPNVRVRVIPMNDRDALNRLFNDLGIESDVTAPVTKQDEEYARAYHAERPLGPGDAFERARAEAASPEARAELHGLLAKAQAANPGDRRLQWVKENGDALLDTIMDVMAEVLRASTKHRAMASPHEGYAVIKEELDELWDLVKDDSATGEAAREEAVQIAAMGIRYVLDVIKRRNA